MAKNNAKLSRWVWIIIATAGTLVGIGIAWGTLNKGVEDNTVKIEVVSEKVDKNERDVITIKADIKYIKKGIDEIKGKL